jgi:hypothetical protein
MRKPKYFHPENLGFFFATSCYAIMASRSYPSLQTPCNLPLLQPIKCLHPEKPDDSEPSM